MRVYKDTSRVWDYNNLTGALSAWDELDIHQYLVYPERHGAFIGWVTAYYDPKGFYGPGVIEVNGYFPEMGLAVRFARCLEKEIPEEEDLLPGYYRDEKGDMYFDPDLKDDIRAEAEETKKVSGKGGKKENLLPGYFKGEDGNVYYSPDLRDAYFERKNNPTTL